MIPIPLLAKLASPAAKAALKAFLGDNLKKLVIVASIFGVVLLIIGFYKHWEYKVFNEGVKATVAAYEKRDHVADLKALERLEQVRKENAIKEEKDNEHFKNVATVYSEEIRELNDRVNDLSSKRMSISTKAPKNCGTGTVEKTNDEQGSVGAGGGIFEVEIERETGKNLRQIIEEIRKGEISCGLVADDVRRAFDVK